MNFFHPTMLLQIEQVLLQIEQVLLQIARPLVLQIATLNELERKEKGH